MGWFKEKQRGSDLLPSGYTAGREAPAPVVDVVVYEPQSARVVGTDGRARAGRRGPGLAIEGERSVLVLRPGLVTGMTGGQVLDITRERPGGELAARVSQVGLGRYAVESPVAAFGFERRASPALAAASGCAEGDFGGIWDLDAEGRPIARSFPRYEQGKGLVALLIERYELAQPLSLVVFLLAAREALAAPSHPNR